MKKNEKIKVGISVGDINGIGLEVILKTFEDNRMLDFCVPIIFCSSKVVSFYKKVLNLNIQINNINSIDKVVPTKINVLNIWDEPVDIELGKETGNGGKYAFLSLQAATRALQNNKIDVLVTAPINKHNIQSKEFNFKGHTEYLESKFEGDSLMILMTDQIRIGLITGHIPVQQISENITPEQIKNKVHIMHKSLIQDFAISKPKIAILGLNPHCGDNGIIGKEDDEIIRPIIDEIQKDGKLVYGPYAADSFFGSESYKNFDAVLAMYHDQGLGPFKTMAFGKGVNFTAGLNIIRTSPDHGTAFEIAGKNKANFSSFKEALFVAIKIYKSRKNYINMSENRLETKIK